MQNMKSAFSLRGSLVGVAPAAYSLGAQWSNTPLVTTRVELSMPSPFFTLIPPFSQLSHCPSQCEVHCCAALMQCPGPTSPPCKNPHVQFQFSSSFHHSPYLIKSALSGSRALETALWGPWTSKTNGDPSMLRLEADPPCGFCMYGEQARGRVELGGGAEGCRR